jgi:hypothetical protein
MGLPIAAPSLFIASDVGVHLAVLSPCSHLTALRPRLASAGRRTEASWPRLSLKSRIMGLTIRALTRAYPIV